MRHRRSASRAAMAVLVVALVAGTAVAGGTEGFLREWAICAPLAGTSLDAPKLPQDFAPYPGLIARDRLWVRAETDADGHLDLRELYPDPPTGTALAHTFFKVPAKGVYVLRVGSDDAVRVDVDGRKVHHHDVERPWSPDSDEVRMKLDAGWHRMLVRVVEYGAQWGLSVRVADELNRPIKVPHQAAVPEPLRKAYARQGPADLEERSEATLQLARAARRVRRQLDAARSHLSRVPEGYVTFAEYAGARDVGLRFFEAFSALWQVLSGAHIPPDRLAEAERTALAAAGDLAPGLTEPTRKLIEDMIRAGQIWDDLGRKGLHRAELVAAAAGIGDVMVRSRRLVDRIETEHVRIARLENDIRNYRQRDLRVRVLDVEGGAVPNAEVEIVQTGHDFLFGCNAFAFGRWPKDRDNRRYAERFERLFNFATVPLFWSAMESDGDGFRRDLARTVEWAERENIRVRGYPLLAPEAIPSRIEKMKPDEARKTIARHVRDVVRRWRDRVDWWCVLSNPGGGELGPAKVTADEALRWVHREHKQGRLMIDHHDAGRLVRVARELTEAGAPLDAVGVTAHQHDGAWPVQMVRRVISHAAGAKLPVHFSGVTILGGPRDEPRQAEAVRRFYTTAFAHPRVVAITWWDLSDRFAWQHAPAGLLRHDLSPKPAYEALDRLINELWRTDAAGRTDDDGYIAVRGFYGRYRITARHDGRERTVHFHLSPEADEEVRISLPARG